MISAKSKKGQIIIIDILLFLIIILLIISIQTKIIRNYKENLSFQEKEINFLKEDFLIENYLLDCNYLGYLDKDTKKCYKNKIEIKNIDKIDYSIFCKLKINENIIFYIENKNNKKIYKRAAVFEDKFTILEVEFCEK